MPFEGLLDQAVLEGVVGLDDHPPADGDGVDGGRERTAQDRQLVVDLHPQGLEGALRRVPAGAPCRRRDLGVEQLAALSLGAQQNAHQIVRDLQVTLNKSIREGLRTGAKRIHSELKATFKPAAEGIAKAAQHFGPDTSSDEIVLMSADAIKPWKQVGSYTSTLDAVSIAYRHLIVDVLRDPVDKQVSLFVTGDAVDLM